MGIAGSSSIPENTTMIERKEEPTIISPVAIINGEGIEELREPAIINHSVQRRGNYPNTGSAASGSLGSLCMLSLGDQAIIREIRPSYH